LIYKCRKIVDRIQDDANKNKLCGTDAIYKTDNEKPENVAKW